MAQEIKKANIFGRLGTSTGKALAEQLPKEVERFRLKSGLQQFAQKYPESAPLQQFAEVNAIPGITPQGIQTLGELAKVANSRSAYANAAGQGVAKPGRQGQEPQVLAPRDVQFANLPRRSQQGAQPIPGEEGVSNYPQSPNVSPSQSEQPQVVDENPLASKYAAIAPWPAQRRNESRLNYRNMGFTPNEADELQADDERRERETPDIYKKELERLRDVQEKLRQEFTRALIGKLGSEPSNKLGPDGKPIGRPRGISEEMEKNLERGAERDLRTKVETQTSLNDIINDWSNRALDVAKARSGLEEALDPVDKITGYKEFFSPNDPIIDRLKGYSEIFRKAGGSEEFSNILRAKGQMSPQGAASVSDPPSKTMQEFISKHKGPGVPSFHNPAKTIERRRINASKTATDLADVITEKDSILAIAQELKRKDPNFDEKSFFDQLRFENESGTSRLSPRHAREIASGASSFVPYWGDVLILPWGKH